MAENPRQAIWLAVWFWGSKMLGIRVSLLRHKKPPKSKDFGGFLCLKPIRNFECYLSQLGGCQLFQ